MEGKDDMLGPMERAGAFVGTMCVPTGSRCQARHKCQPLRFHPPLHPPPAPAMHGPDPLLEGKHLAFEAQLREEMGRHATRGINMAEAELPGVMDRARQGLATLRRRLSDSIEGIGWGGGAGGAGGTNNPPPEVGEVGPWQLSCRVGVVWGWSSHHIMWIASPPTQVGYGDPASELHGNMKEAMEEAAKVS